MAQKTWTWMHGTDRIYVEQARITPDMVGGPQTGYLIEKATPLWRAERRCRCRPRGQRGAELRCIAHARHGALESVGRRSVHRLELARARAGSPEFGATGGSERTGLARRIRRTARPLRLGEQWSSGVLRARSTAVRIAWPHREQTGASTGGSCGWRDWGTYRRRNRRRNTISLLQTAHVHDHHDQGRGIFAVDSRYD